MPRTRAVCSRYTTRIAPVDLVAKMLNQLYVDGYTETQLFPYFGPAADSPQRFLIVAVNPNKAVDFEEEEPHGKH